jgi:hypothetical protein
VVGPDGERPPRDRLSLAPDEVLVAGDGALETVVRFETPAHVDPPALADGGGGATRAATGPGGTTVAFEGTAPVAVGFRERAPDPPTVTVPATPTGVATAITHASAALGTLGPERSHPSRRSHPPLVAFGDQDVPAAVARATPETGIELRLPADLSTCSLAAPLAFYLGATVRAEDRSAPVLRVPATGLRRVFPAAGAAFADAVSGLLRRVFLLDCLTRDRPGERLAGREVLDRLGLDAARLRSLSPAERLTAHLAAPLDRLDDLPDWPLATYVDGGIRTARCLPHLLDRLSLIHPAAASAIDGDSLLCRALDEFYRGPSPDGDEDGVGRTVRPAPDPSSMRRTEDVVTADRLMPELRDARVHGWLADGTPVEAFTSTPEAYRNRLAAPERDATLDIAVVCNDPEMSDERAVADIYREGAAGLPVDVTVTGSLARGELADLLATPHDFVHYIGHCEGDGLQCRDGFLDVADVDTVRARTFFLNACGSYQQGKRLVSAGSVAGAVTLTTVLNRQAVTVGTAFARLLIHGAGFERALSLARQEILMGSDYAVVGDGTDALAPARDATVLHVTPVADGYEVATELLSGGDPGRSYASPVTGEDRLDGRVSPVTVGRGTLRDLLADRTVPVVYDGRLRRSTDLAATLRPDPDSGD